MRPIVAHALEADIEPSEKLGPAPQLPAEPIEKQHVDRRVRQLVEELRATASRGHQEQRHPLAAECSRYFAST